MVTTSALARMALHTMMVMACVCPAQAGVQTFNSSAPADNASVRADWIAAIGSPPDYLVDFESGFSNNQNISGMPGLFPAGLVIRDTSAGGAAIIRSGSGVINGSNPVGVFSVTHDESRYLGLDFSSAPVSYVGFLDIDHSGTNGILELVGGAEVAFRLEPTGASGNTAEFFGIWRNDMPRITRVWLDASGDGRWGLDNIEYGGLAKAPVIPEPSFLAGGVTALFAAVLMLRPRRRL